MKHLIVQDWATTSGNHAGMMYLCKKMHNLYPTDIKVYSIRDYFYKDYRVNPRKVKLGGFILKILNFIAKKLAKRKFSQRIHQIVNEISLNIHNDDDIIFMEYLEVSYPLVGLAYHLKKNFPKNRLSALIHLVPQKLDSTIDNEKFTYWMNPIDRIFTFGHSLSDYLVNRGVDNNKVKTVYHYVDSYYHNDNIRVVSENESIKVIAMGNQMRNIQVLQRIIESNKDVKFVICQGLVDMSDSLGRLPNVELLSFVTEDVLRDYMKNADVSLNVMIDTIGSNVIVTSMAMGLAMVNSDVGSIRDYCSDDNAIFCDNNDISTFSKAISTLCRDKSRLNKMKIASSKISKEFTIEKFYAEL